MTWSKLAAFILLCLAAPGCSAVETETSQPELNRDLAVDRAVRQWMSKENITGASIAIVRDGHTVVEKGFGIANLRSGQPVTEATRFRLDSVTKEFTAAAALVALSSHHMSPSQVVGSTAHCPHGYGSARYIDLIDHTAGYRVRADSGNFGTSTPLSSRLRLLCGTLRHSNVWSYRNDGYLVLSDAIASLAERPFAAYMRSAVFEWARMRSAGFERTGDDARGYNCSRGTGEELPDTALESVGAGEALATAGDVARWNAKLLAGQYPSPGGDVFGQGGRISDRSHYSYGFEVIDDARNGRIARHSGFSGGYSAINVLFLDKMAAVTILTNCDNIDSLDFMANKLFVLTT